MEIVELADNYNFTSLRTQDLYYSVLALQPMFASLLSKNKKYKALLEKLSEIKNLEEPPSDSEIRKSLEYSTTKFRSQLQQICADLLEVLDQKEYVVDHRNTRFRLVFYSKTTNVKTQEFADNLFSLYMKLDSIPSVGEELWFDFLRPKFGYCTFVVHAIERDISLTEMEIIPFRAINW